MRNQGVKDIPTSIEGKDEDKLNFQDLYKSFEESMKWLDYRKSLNLSEKMIQISEDDVQEYWSRVLSCTLSISFQQGSLDITNTTDIAEHAYLLSKRTNNKKMELDAKVLIALIKKQSGKWEELLEVSAEILELSDELNDTDSLIYARLYLSYGHSMMKHFTESEAQLEIAYNLAESDPIMDIHCDSQKIVNLLAFGNFGPHDEINDTRNKILATADDISKKAERVGLFLSDSHQIIHTLQNNVGLFLFSFPELSKKDRDNKKYTVPLGIENGGDFLSDFVLYCLAGLVIGSTGGLALIFLIPYWRRSGGFLNPDGSGEWKAHV